MNKLEELTAPLYTELKELIKLMSTSYEEGNSYTYCYYSRLAVSVKAYIHDLERAYK